MVSFNARPWFNNNYNLLTPWITLIIFATGISDILALHAVQPKAWRRMVGINASHTFEIMEPRTHHSTFFWVINPDRRVLKAMFLPGRDTIVSMSTNSSILFTDYSLKTDSTVQSHGS